MRQLHLCGNGPSVAAGYSEALPAGRASPAHVPKRQEPSGCHLHLALSLGRSLTASAGEPSAFGAEKFGRKLPVSFIEALTFREPRQRCERGAHQARGHQWHSHLSLELTHEQRQFQRPSA